MSARVGQRFPHHRAQRRDARAAGDEQQMALSERRRQPEGAQRSFDSQQRSRHRAFEMRIRAGVIVDLDEQLECPVVACVAAARRQSSTAAAPFPRPARRRPPGPRRTRMAAAEIERDDSRARCRLTTSRTGRTKDGKVELVSVSFQSPVQCEPDALELKTVGAAITARPRPAR